MYQNDGINNLDVNLRGCILGYIYNNDKDG
jgi:hypothetical protein